MPGKKISPEKKLPSARLLLFWLVACLGLATPPGAALADYWAGTAPFCNGQCRKGERQIGSSKCGDGACCWSGHKALCTSSTPQCAAKQTKTQCYGVVMICDNGSYVAPTNVWKSCGKYACGVCLGFSSVNASLQTRAFRPNVCQAGFVARAAFPGDEVCVSPASRARAAADNRAAAARRAAGGGAYGADTCQQGFVWREARPDDHVCVPPQRRADVARENEARLASLRPLDRPYGADACKQGFVWREAIPDDRVCVTPQARDLARAQNDAAAARKSPTGGDYGQDTCKQGFVWREVVPEDRVCVPPAERAQAADDNRAAEDRRAAN